MICKSQNRCNNCQDKKICYKECTRHLYDKTETAKDNFEEKNLEMKVVWEIVGKRFQNSSNCAKPLEDAFEILKRLILNLSIEEKATLKDVAIGYDNEINQMVNYLADYEGPIQTTLNI